MIHEDYDGMHLTEGHITRLPATARLSKLRKSWRSSAALKSERGSSAGSVRRSKASDRGSTFSAAEESFRSTVKRLVPRYIIMPFHRWKGRWDLVILALVLLSSFVVPFDVAYRQYLDPEECSNGNEYFKGGCPWGLSFDTLEVFFFIIFITDLVISFFVSYQDVDGSWKISLSATSRRYLRTWFIVDLLAVVPFDLVVDSDEATLVKLFKVLRLLRLGKLMKRSNELVTSGRAVATRFLRMLGSVLIIMHWFACLLRYVSPSLDDDPFYRNLRDDRGVGGLYVFDLYSSLTLLLGESLSHPKITEPQAIAAMFTMLIGAVVLAALFGQVAMLVANYNSAKTRLMEKMEQVDESMKSCRLPASLQASIRDYYVYTWKRHKTISAQNFFDDLSPGLRSKTTLYLYQDVLGSVPLFAKVPVAVMETLALAVEASVYMPGDVIIREGEVGDEMFIVGDGRVRVMKDGRQLAVIGRGAHFGEMALLTRDKRRAFQVESDTISDVYRLGRADFNHIVALHPKLRADMLEEAEKRRAANRNVLDTGAKITTAANVVSSLASDCQDGGDEGHSSGQPPVASQATRRPQRAPAAAPAAAFVAHAAEAAEEAIDPAVKLAAQLAALQRADQAPPPAASEPAAVASAGEVKAEVEVAGLGQCVQDM